MVYRQGDLNFAFDQRESKVNLHKATSLPESPSNVSPDAGDRIDGIMVSVPALSVVDRGFDKLALSARLDHSYETG
jgi:hypothetical protein